MSARDLRMREGHRGSLHEWDAFWQYMIDHAHIDTNGHYKIMIGTIKSRESFEKSIRARQMGLYRYTEQEIRAMKPLNAKGMKHPQPPKSIQLYHAWMQLYKTFLSCLKT